MYAIRSYYVFLAAQPLYLQLSFRAYSEITAGLFIVLSLYFV